MIRLAHGLAAVAAFAAPLWAHHSAAAEYDASRLLVLTGTVAKVEWTNPHVYCHLAVKNRTGTIDWYLEMGSPNGMRQEGWTQNTLKPGDAITVEAYAAKDSATLAKTHRVRLADGRWLFVDSGRPSHPAGP